MDDGADDRDSLPFQPHSLESLEAARSMPQRCVVEDRMKIYRTVLEKGPLTDEQIQDVTGMPANTERPRRVECVEQGLLIKDDERGRTRSGRPAAKWKAIPNATPKPLPKRVKKAG